MFRGAVPGKYAKRSACLVAERKLSGHQFRAGRGSRCSHAPGNFSRRGFSLFNMKKYTKKYIRKYNK